METQEQFTARMATAQEAAFSEFCKRPHVAKLLGHAPTPLHAHMLRSMFSSIFDAGASFGVTKMLAELENVSRTEL